MPPPPDLSAADQLELPEPGRVRAAKQERSAQRQQRIADAAVAVIARRGIAGVTHRLVAREARVSLAATTYYYQTKQDIIADASRQLLAGYVDAFQRFAKRHYEDPTLSFRDFAMRLVTNAAGKHRTGTLAWCEIILYCAQHPEMRELARTWFTKLAEVWLDIAQILRVADPRDAIPSALDIVIGLLFVVVPLGISEAEAAIVLVGHGNAGEMWGVLPAEAGHDQIAKNGGRKAQQTRERVLAAAIEILIAGGPTAVTYRAVADQAGLTPAAPTYHFASIDALLNAAQVRVFEQSKDRYRQVMAGIDRAEIDIDRLADLTTRVFMREATEFGAVSLANWPIRLEAARHPRLRWMVRSAIYDQNRAWSRLLGQLTSRQRALDPLIMQSLFVGKLVRVLATGCEARDLAEVHTEFTRELHAIVGGNHWSGSR
jgi:DNA-binding transcriptional regulator YbjK